jgi:hypothetical protein
MKTASPSPYNYGPARRAAGFIPAAINALFNEH